MLLAFADAGAVRRPTYGGVLRIGLAEAPGTADPAHAVTPSDWLAVGLVHSGLYRLEGDGAAPDMLAEPCKREAGGKRWRCRLRRGVYAHDGRAVVAADVRSSFARLGGSAHGWVPRLLAVESKGDTAFVVTTPFAMDSRDFGLLLASPALSIVRGPSAAAAGPFRAASWSSRDGTASLGVHLQFHGGRPYMDGVSIKGFGTPERVVEAFHYGSVDLVLEDSRRYKDPLRIAGPARETLGIVVMPRLLAQPALSRLGLFRAAPRADLATRASGQTAAARDLLPGGTGLGGGSGRTELRWFVGCPDVQRSFCEALAAGLGPPGRPWPIEPLEAATVRSALRRPSSAKWDAIVVDHLHVDPWPGAALRTLASLAGVEAGAAPDKALRDRMAWIPLVDRGRTAIVSRAFRGVRWTAAGVLDLSGVWRPQ